MDTETTSSVETAPAPPAPASSARDWETLSDHELLGWRICDLRLDLKDSEVEPLVHRLYTELEAKGVKYHPPCYLTTEWLCPDKVPLIGIPFCLAHPRLKSLEKAMMLEVEGGNEADCLKLLRHECGHAINYAYQLYHRSRWRELFGPFSQAYNVQEYYPRPYSRKFVVHLERNYAQAHPDEDFAETFAIWLTPNLDWRTRYRDWGALKKLEYVDHLMKECGSHPPKVSHGARLWPVGKVRSTLDSYYRKKRREFADAYPAYYDPDLLRLFSPEADSGRTPVSVFLQKRRRMLTQEVARWSRMPKYTVDQLIRRLSRRAAELRLYLRHSEDEAMVPVSVYLTTLACDNRERQETADEG